jgi:iron only hydrogenase large subunit-like protein
MVQIGNAVMLKCGLRMRESYLMRMANGKEWMNRNNSNKSKSINKRMGERKAVKRGCVNGGIQPELNLTELNNYGNLQNYNYGAL